MSEVPIITDEDRAGWQESVARFERMSESFDAAVNEPLVVRLFRCACTARGGCNEFVDALGAWCPLCFNSAACRPELRAGWWARWAADRLERLACWLREHRLDRNRSCVVYSERKATMMRSGRIVLTDPELMRAEIRGRKFEFCDSAGEVMLDARA